MNFFTLALVLGAGLVDARGYHGWHYGWHHKPHYGYGSSSSPSSASSLPSSTAKTSLSLVTSTLTKTTASPTTLKSSTTKAASSLSTPEAPAVTSSLARPSSSYASSSAPVASSSAKPSSSTKPASSYVSSSSAAPLATATGAVWQPEVNSTWQIVLDNAIQLSADATSVTPDVSVYDIDLFGNDDTVMTGLRGLDKKVVCYFSAGSFEPGRPDSDDFEDGDKGSELDGWPGEYWLDVNSANVRSIMSKRIALAKEKGCHGIDPDNVDGYNNENGLGLTSADSVDYIKFLAAEAKSHGLATGLKNAGDIISKVLPVVQFSVNEQCVEYSECHLFASFIDDGKPVFHIEYPSSAPSIKAAVKSSYCSATGDAAGSENFSTVLKTMDLTGWVEFCNGATATTPSDTS